jgi:hypothetical protein
LNNLTHLTWGRLSKAVIQNCEGSPKVLRKIIRYNLDVLEEEPKEFAPRHEPWHCLRASSFDQTRGKSPRSDKHGL